MKHKELTDNIINNYAVHNPHVSSILNFFKEHEEKIIIDHLSFRTFDLPYINIDVLSAPFLKVGYQEINRYKNSNQNTKARYYEHQHDKSAPLIFISELFVDNQIHSYCNHIKEMINKIPIDILCTEKILNTSRSWSKPSFLVYKKVNSESQYAAGIYLNGFLPHHISIRINDFQNFNTIKRLSQFLSENKITYHIKNSSKQNYIIPLIEQILVSPIIKKVSFIEGDYEISIPNIEFTRRSYLADNSLYMGFLPDVVETAKNGFTLEQLNELLLEDN